MLLQNRTQKNTFLSSGLRKTRNQLTSLQHKTFNCKCFRASFLTDLLMIANQPMTNSVESIVISLGNEPAEVLGFKTEKQIETALIPLMEEVFHDEEISFK